MLLSSSHLCLAIRTKHRSPRERLLSHMRYLVTLMSGWLGPAAAGSYFAPMVTAAQWRALLPAALDNLYARALLGERVFYAPQVRGRGLQAGNTMLFRCSALTAAAGPPGLVRVIVAPPVGHPPMPPTCCTHLFRTPQGGLTPEEHLTPARAVLAAAMDVVLVLEVSEGAERVEGGRRGGTRV